MARPPTEQPNTSNMTPVPGVVTPPQAAPARPAYPPAPNPYLRTPLPSGQQLQPDVLRQFYSLGAPQVRIVPLPTTAQASINASAKGIAKTVAQQVLATSGITSASLSMPNIFSVAGSPGGPPAVNFVVALASEIANTVFAGPSNTAIDLIDTSTIGGAGASPLVMNATPLHSNDLAMLFTCQDNRTVTTLNPGAPWTSIPFTGNQTVYSQSLSGLTPASATGATGTFGGWASVLLLLTGKAGFTPTIVNHAVIVSGAVSSWTNVSIGGFTPTAGNSLLAFCASGALDFFGVTFGIQTFGDSQGNTWEILGTAIDRTVGTAGEEVIVLGAHNIAGGAITFTGSVNATVANFEVGVVEVSNLAIVTSLPKFRPLVSGDIPPINLNRNNTNGGVTGILGRANLPAAVAYTDTNNIFTVPQTLTSGGGNTQLNTALNGISVRYDLNPNGFSGPGIVNISTTGSTFPALVFNPQGGSTSDIIQSFVSGSTTTKNFILASTGKFSNYNAIATVSNGVPAEYQTVDLSAQGAAITATTLYPVPASGAGMYRISWVATVTQAATISSILGGTNGFQIVYTDNDTSVVKTMPGTIVAGIDTNSNNSTATGTISGCFIAHAKASTNIQYQMDYTSSGVTPMQFNLHIKLEAM